jgi:glutamate-1-semialdehyde 2,1-aminomutase
MRLGTAVQQGWTRLAAKHGLAVHVGGIPPLSHFAFDRDPAASKAYFVQLMADEGILASTLYYPMWAHRDEHVRRYLDACDGTFARLAEAHASDGLAKRLRGAPAVSGFRRLN